MVKDLCVRQKLIGKSMEPLISNGTYRVLQSPWLSPKTREVGIFKLADAADSETGGCFEVKCLNNRQVVDRDEPRLIGTLAPKNRPFNVIVVDTNIEDSVRPGAAFVRVLGPSRETESASRESGHSVRGPE